MGQASNRKRQRQQQKQRAVQTEKPGAAADAASEAAPVLAAPDATTAGDTGAETVRGYMKDTPDTPPKRDPREKGRRANIKDANNRERMDVLVQRDLAREADIRLLREEMVRRDDAWANRVNGLQNLFVSTDIHNQSMLREVVQELYMTLRVYGTLSSEDVDERLEAAMKAIQARAAETTKKRIADMVAAHTAQLRKEVEEAKLTPEQQREAQMNVELAAELAAMKSKPETRPVVDSSSISISEALCVPQGTIML